VESCYPPHFRQPIDFIMWMPQKGGLSPPIARIAASSAVLVGMPRHTKRGVEGGDRHATLKPPGLAMDHHITRGIHRRVSRLRHIPLSKPAWRVSRLGLGWWFTVGLLAPVKHEHSPQLL
jgi:hypothetical protein